MSLLHHTAEFRDYIEQLLQKCPQCSTAPAAVPFPTPLNHLLQHLRAPQPMYIKQC
jgi:hypothetical protein